MAIIVSATDFSEVADHATDYACKMAKAYGASLTILHSYIIPVSITDNPMPVLPINEMKEIAEEQMTKVSERAQAACPDVAITTHLSYGDITGSLKEYAEERRPWMVVVGNSSEEGMDFWGGNLLSELRKLSCPVMAVPQGTDFVPAKKICLACDLKNVDEHLPVAEIVDLVAKTKASLHVLNVDYNNHAFGTETPLEAAALHDMLKAVDPEYHYITNEDVEAGIEKFVSENNIDWLIVTPHKHGFWEGLFRKSHTKQIVRKIHIPIIALHEH